MSLFYLEGKDRKKKTSTLLYLKKQIYSFFYLLETKTFVMSSRQQGAREGDEDATVRWVKFMKTKRSRGVGWGIQGTGWCVQCPGRLRPITGTLKKKTCFLVYVSLVFVSNKKPRCYGKTPSAPPGGSVTPPPPLREGGGSVAPCWGESDMHPRVFTWTCPSSSNPSFSLCGFGGSKVRRSRSVGTTSSKHPSPQRRSLSALEQTSPPPDVASH